MQTEENTTPAIRKYSVFHEPPSSEQRNIAMTIFAKMGGWELSHRAIHGIWRGAGIHQAGGLLIMLDWESSKENGEVYLVSYHLRDDLTITYGKRDKKNPENAIIITEKEHINIENLCQEFTDITGHKIPIVACA